jgi:AbiV family abortive infection protein
VTREADNPKGDDLSRIRRNAGRLLRDAKLLSDNKRYASAFAVAVLGLEEIGKSILRQWNLSNYSGHPNKQLAVSSLLIVDAMMRELQKPRRGMINPADFGQPRSAAALERIIKATMESEAGRFSKLVDAKALEKIKQFCFYYDGVLEDAGVHPDHFTYADVERIFKMCVAALKKTEDDQALMVAKVMFLAKSKGRSKMIRISITAAAFDAIAAMRGPGESYSDVILRIAEQDALAAQRG